MNSVELASLTRTIAGSIARRGFFLLMDGRLALVCGAKPGPAALDRATRFAARHEWEVRWQNGMLLFCASHKSRRLPGGNRPPGDELAERGRSSTVFRLKAETRLHGDDRRDFLGLHSFRSKNSPARSHRASPAISRLASCRHSESHPFCSPFLAH